jgi:hypothetical protein
MSFGLTTITQGLFPGGFPPGFKSLVYGGLPTNIGQALPPPNRSETPHHVGASAAVSGLSSQGLSDADLILRDASGSIVVPTTDGFLDLGSGTSLSFDPDTLQGLISPALFPSAGTTIDIIAGQLTGDSAIGYTGSDVRIMLETAINLAPGVPRFHKQLMECTTLTISNHRSRSQVRAGGFINPRGIARGNRTIAGTMIMTQFTADVLFRFLNSTLIKNDLSKDSHYSKVDQLPPFNATLIFSNEYGFASYRRLLGIEFVTDGTVISQNDMYIEQTVTFYATDFTVLLPLTLSSLYSPPLGFLDQRFNSERTVQDLWSTAF